MKKSCPWTAKDVIVTPDQETRITSTPPPPPSQDNFYSTLDETRDTPLSIDHFLVIGLVTWLLNGSEAGVDLVLIHTSLVLLCKSSCSYWLIDWQIFIMLTRWHLQEKNREVCIKAWSPPASLALPCIGVARGKFELTNQDSAGGKNFPVLTSS